MQETHVDMGFVKDTLIVYVFGRGTAEYCPDLNVRIKEFFQNHKIVRVLFDTQEASYMDSSFIGVILAVRKRFSKDDAVYLLNPDPRIIEIFEVMGLTDFVPAIHLEGLHDLKGTIQISQKLENSVSDMRLLLEAHQNIMETSPENQARFKTVEKVLRQEIERKKKI